MDEAVFTSSQISTKSWFLPQSKPILIPRKKLGFKAIAVAAAINMDGNLVALHVVDHSINAYSFAEFLGKVGKYLKRRKAKMLVDNLGVHHTYIAKSAAKKAGVQLVYNGIYSSEFNPIERLWAWSKARFTKRCFENVPFHLQHRMRALVTDVLNEDYSIGLRKRIDTCIAAMKMYLNLSNASDC